MGDVPYCHNLSHCNYQSGSVLCKKETQEIKELIKCGKVLSYLDCFLILLSLKILRFGTLHGHMLSSMYIYYRPVCHSCICEIVLFTLIPPLSPSAALAGGPCGLCVLGTGLHGAGWGGRKPSGAGWDPSEVLLQPRGSTTAAFSRGRHHQWPSRAPQIQVLLQETMALIGCSKSHNRNN